MSAITLRMSPSHCVKPAGTAVAVFCGHSADAGVDRQAEGDDALRGQVGAVLRVGDDGVEELVDRDEVRAAHVPVRLLSVHGQGLQARGRRG